MSDKKSSYKSRQVEDTITLIDLIAEIVRYRRLVVLGTFLSGALAIVVLFLGPLIGLEIGPQIVYTAEQRILINQVPADLEQYITINPAAAVRTILQSPGVVGEVYRPFEEDPPEDRTEEQYLTMVRQSVIGDIYGVEWDEDTQILALSFTDASPEHAIDFLARIVGIMGAELTSQAGPQIAETARAIETAIIETERTVARLFEQAVPQLAFAEVSVFEIVASVDGIAGMDLNSLAILESAAERLYDVATDARSLYTLLGTPTVYEDQTGNRAVIVIIATMTAFFVSMFLAFMLGFVRRIKQDPEEMAKLKAAWKRD